MSKPKDETKLEEDIDPADSGDLPESADPETQSSKVARSAGIVSIAVMASRILGLIREQVFAYFFGSGYLYDAYQVAFRIPNVLRDLFAEGALSVAFVKVFTDYQLDRTEEEAWKLASLVLNGIVVILSVITIIGILFAPQIVSLMAPGFPDEIAELATVMTRIMFPFILFIAMAALAMGVLNTKGIFGVPASASTAFNLVSIFLGLGFAYWLSGGGWEVPPRGIMPSRNAELAIIGMSIGTLIAGASQFLIQLPWLWKLGFRFSPVLDFADEGVRKVARLMAPAIVGTSAVQINVFVNTMLASGIEGGVSYLSYAFRLMQFPIGVFGVAIGTATIPALSRLANKKNIVDFRDTLSNSLNLVFLLTLPSACGLVVLGSPIISLLYSHGGAFTEDDVPMTAIALAAYAIGLTGYAAIKVLSPAFYALDEARIPMIIGICSIVVNAVAGYTFLQIFSTIGVDTKHPHGYGHAGVALATSCVALVNFTALLIMMRRKIGGVNAGKLLQSFLKIAIASAIMSGVCWFSYQYLTQLTTTKRLFQQLYEVAIPVALGVIVFFIVAKILRVHELEEFIKMLRRRLGR